MADNPYFQVRGKRFFDRPFFNGVLSTNIAVYSYLAGILFNGDLSRIVWASTDSMFRKRREQIAARKLNSSPKDDLGLLELPFCSFRLVQDGIRPNSNRNWWNPALHVEGMWFEELGRRLRITPATLTYEACFICNHDTDLYAAQQDLIWDKNAETIVESFLDTVSPEGDIHTLKNIIVYDAEPSTNSMFTEHDWLEKNKMQTITLAITCQTWLIADDKHHRYSITKKVLLNFLQGAGYHNLIHGEGDVDIQTEQIVWNLFMGENVSGKMYPLTPENMEPVPPPNYNPLS